MREHRANSCNIRVRIQLLSLDNC